MADAMYIMLATAGRPKLLGRTLASLEACTKPGIYREAVIVENGPPSGAEALVQAFASTSLRARYLHVPRANKSHALNEAMQTIEDGLIFFTDDDVRYVPHLLTAYAEAAAGAVDGAFYGGPTHVDYEVPPPEWLKRSLPASATGFRLNPGTVLRSVPPTMPGFNWAAFKHDLVAAGGFDEQYGPGSPENRTGQESTMQKRLIKRGVYGHYVPDAAVWHYVPEKRCTPEWAKKRAYRDGKKQGALYHGADRHLFGYPMPALLRSVQSLLGVVKHALRADRAAMFASYCRCYYHMGWMTAYHRSATPPEAETA